MRQVLDGGSMGGTDAGSGALALQPGVHLPGRRDDDPLAPVLALGNRAVQVGATIGMSIALLLHGAASVRAVTSLFEMRRVAESMHSAMHEFFWAQYEVEMPAKKVVEEKPPEKEPEPAPVVQQPTFKAPAPKNDDPYEPPPQAAQAAKVLTAPADPEEPLDLTGEGFVSGDGTGLGYGMVSGQGRSTTPTYNPHASNTGVPGGKGTSAAPPPPPPQGPDLSRNPDLVGSKSWSDCGFPAEADAEQIDEMVVVVVVTVRPDGTPQSVKVISDPGYGFGRQARVCALGKRYTPGLDRQGKPTLMSMPPIRIRFSR